MGPIPFLTLPAELTAQIVPKNCSANIPESPWRGKSPFMYTILMSLEGFKDTPKQPLEKDPFDVLQKLFTKLPDELAADWEERVQDLPIEQQIEKIQAVISAREKQKQHTSKAELLPRGVEIYTSFPDDLREIIEETRDGDRTTEVGYGKAGHVIADKELHPGICYKMLFDDEVLPEGTNDISHETELLYEIGEQLDGFAGVRVPHVYGFIKEPGTRAITMELLDAPSLRRITERRIAEMPEKFDEVKFFTALRSFIAELHARGYYHRDLHAGNVLVDKETGMPCVIDFGLSKYVPIADGEEYRETFVKDGQMVQLVLQSDLDNLELLEAQVRKYQQEDVKGTHP